MSASGHQSRGGFHPTQFVIRSRVPTENPVETIRARVPTLDDFQKGFHGDKTSFREDEEQLRDFMSEFESLSRGGESEQTSIESVSTAIFSLFRTVDRGDHEQRIHKMCHITALLNGVIRPQPSNLNIMGARRDLWESVETLLETLQKTLNDAERTASLITSANENVESADDRVTRDEALQAADLLCSCKILGLWIGCVASLIGRESDNSRGAQ